MLLMCQPLDLSRNDKRHRAIAPRGELRAPAVASGGWVHGGGGSSASATSGARSPTAAACQSAPRRMQVRCVMVRCCAKAPGGLRAPAMSGGGWVPAGGGNKCSRDQRRSFTHRRGAAARSAARASVAHNVAPLCRGGGRVERAGGGRRGVGARRRRLECSLPPAWPPASTSGAAAGAAARHDAVPVALPLCRGGGCIARAGGARREGSAREQRRCTSAQRRPRRCPCAPRRRARAAAAPCACSASPFSVRSRS
jgi:hypothetical protein